ncbi:MAG: DoxX family protein, partial [Candidatus Binatia bacterium]
METTTLVTMSEAALRVILGWRMLVSGISNVRRWPNPANTASILFPKGATFFGSAATFLMVAGGFGVAAGIQTPICAVMILIFLIPTFALHWHWLKVLPTMSPAVSAAISDDKARNYFRS